MNVGGTRAAFFLSVALAAQPRSTVVRGLLCLSRRWLHNNAKLVQSALADANEVAQDALGSVRAAQDAHG